MIKSVIACLAFFMFVFFPFLSAGGEDEFPKAYRDINFGDSWEEVNKKIKEDESIDFPKSKELKETAKKSHILAQTTLSEYSFFLLFSFWDDQLFVMELFSSLARSDPNNPRLRDEKDFLLRVMREKHGLNTDATNIERRTRYIWNPGQGQFYKEKILIRVSIEKSTNIFGREEYQALLIINYPPLQKEYRRAKIEEEKQKAREVQKAREEAAQNF